MNLWRHNNAACVNAQSERGDQANCTGKGESRDDACGLKQGGRHSDTKGGGAGKRAEPMAKRRRT